VNQFDTFEDYLDDLKHLGRQRYKAVRNELNRHARSGVELDEKRLTSIDSGELAAMQSVLYSRHQSGVASPFTRSFSMRSSAGSATARSCIRPDGMENF
jgi:predicted N-acyltransferase